MPTSKNAYQDNRQAMPSKVVVMSSAGALPAAGGSAACCSALAWAETACGSYGDGAPCARSSAMSGAEWSSCGGGGFSPGKRLRAPASAMMPAMIEPISGSATMVSYMPLYPGLVVTPDGENSLEQAAHPFNRSMSSTAIEPRLRK